MTKHRKFIAVIVFWLVLIGGFIAVKQYTLSTGEKVLLKTIPVDPRDLFRGDYVILRYDISTVNDNVTTPSGVNIFETGDTVYVLLDIVDGYGVARRVSFTEPEEGLFMKGSVVRTRNNRLEVTYGIESYFIEEGRGGELEGLTGDLDVRVAIDKNGRSLIDAMVLDGEEIDI